VNPQEFTNLVTPVIICFNEEPNLERTLSALTWARRVVILDSGSTDRSREIADAFKNVDWHVRKFDDHARQCNHALDNFVGGAPWVLFMDADYVVTTELFEQLRDMRPDTPESGFSIPFRYCMDGVPLRGTLYPPRVSLFRPESGRYRQYGHMHWLELNGSVGHLSAPMLHDDRKSPGNFLARQRRYAQLEAEYLWSQNWSELNWRKRLRRLLIVAPWAAPLFALFGKGVVLDGLPGLKYAWERALAEALIASALLHQMLSTTKSKI
jgi:glycosyltransferase involved in cell wall biosynthesis